VEPLQPGKAVLGRASAQDFDWKGQVIKDGVALWPIGVDTAKTVIQKRLGLARPGPGYMHFPLGLPDDYYKQLTAERHVKRWVRGYERMVWEKDAGARNEALDTEVYAYAAAMRAGVTRANWDKLEAYFKGTGDLFVAAKNSVTRANGEPSPEDMGTPEKPGTGSAETGGGGEVSAPSSAASALPVPPPPAAPAPRNNWVAPRRDWLKKH
jgi:phage terminase large subunit GpA-like protein